MEFGLQSQYIKHIRRALCLCSLLVFSVGAAEVLSAAKQPHSSGETKKDVAAGVPEHSNWLSPKQLINRVFPLSNEEVEKLQQAPRQLQSANNLAKHVEVNSSSALIKALEAANKNAGPKIIRLQPGQYSLSARLKITANDIQLVGLPQNPAAVVISGQGMRKTKGVDNLIWVSGKNFVLDGLTLQHVGNHLLQIAGERNADGAIIKNCIFRDGYEQLIKVSWGGLDKPTADNGLVENCVFEYTAGIGPNFYIGGIDIHGGKDWVIKNNLFRNIASPEGHIAEHAIHFWSYSQHPIIERNIIIDSDRGIGLGMGKKGNIGGLIRQNVILHHRNNHPYADVGIILENSEGTLVEGNIIFLAQPYYRAIEYRFEGTKDVVIKNNAVNKRIASRNGGKALVENNKTIRAVEEVMSAELLDVLGMRF